MATNAGAYPVNLTVDYPDRELDRVTTLFRLFTIIPIAIVLSLIAGPTLSWTNADQVT